MTKEQILQMAWEAGFMQRHETPNEWWMYTDCIEAFATLVRNVAIEEALHIVKNHFDYTRSEAVAAIESLKEPTT